MRRVPMRLAVVALAASSLLACPGFGDEEAPDLFDEVPETPTFEEHVQPILDKNCVECHGPTPTNSAPPGFRMDVFESPDGEAGVKDLSGRIAFRTSDDSAANPMPPATRSPVGPIDTAILQKWHELGAPRTADDVNNVANNDDNNAVCKPTPQFFVEEIWDSAQEGFMKPSCTACHVPGGIADDGAVELLLDPEDPEASLEVIRQVAAREQDGTSILLLKPSGQVTHTGGMLLPEDSENFANLQELVQRFDEPVACDATDNNDPMDAGNNDMDVSDDADGGNNGVDVGDDAMDVTPDAPPPTRAGTQVDFSSDKNDPANIFFLAISTPRDPSTLIYLTAEATVAGDLSTIDFTFQALSADDADPARSPVGPTLDVNGVAFSAEGTFTASLGDVTIDGAANPFGDADLVVSGMTLVGFVCGGESFCGEVLGMVTAPAEQDLAGSTFGAFLSTEATFDTATPTGDCIPNQCEAE